MAKTTEQPCTTRRYEPNASIALIGIRGAGKRSLGFIAAAHLRRRFVSEGLYFEKVTGYKKSAFIEKFGQDDFYRRNEEVLQQMLDSHGTGCVLECGMATLTTGARTILRQFAQSHPVIHIVRDFQKISQALSLNGDQKAQLYKADLRHHYCSNFEFFNLEDSSLGDIHDAHVSSDPPNPRILRDVKLDFQRFIDFICHRPGFRDSGPFSLSALPLERRRHSFVTSVKLSTLLENNMPETWQDSGEDAIELVLDLFSEGTYRSISEQISRLKRALKIPIVVSLPKQEGAANLTPEITASTLQYVLRLGIDYLLVNLALDEVVHRTLLADKGPTTIIGDGVFPDPTARGWLDTCRIQLCENAEMIGFDTIRLTQPALERQDNEDVRYFAAHVSRAYSITVIAYNTGRLGRTSRVFNRLLTPIRHCTRASLAFVDEDPEDKITISDATSALFECFEMDSLEFYILGQSVFYSCSPPMHNAAFELYGLRHSFTFREIATFSEILAIANTPTFGGSAISFPFKEDAFRACTAMSPHASIIGSVNTLIPLRLLLNENTASLEEQADNRNNAGKVIGLYGDNSDWYGVYISILNRLSPRNTARLHKTTALVLGAGGSARAVIYALAQLECAEIHVRNRTYGNAVKVADHFNAWCEAENRPSRVSAWNEQQREWPADLELPTIVVNCLPSQASLFDDHDQVAEPLPSALLGNPSGGVAVSISYNPRITPFLQQVMNFRDECGIPWRIVTGVDIVFEQALLQFEQLSGYRAPKATMRQALESATEVRTLH
ncbi:uncharacterized protein HMPREF1541_05530 [Cyphellophora europaea CBS 101466]|uniref:Uncharacterized protein n=1 Tax=Cyphellophora europaea (strain CBS 101466) TaxID=1220924 RepID=W2RS76_CYPE1|nr:uncharacterized protein HMPREF1541_05530 [Cyphellophora europaea CBS 101466]ETN39307.1 hypothetical protein HMPREF1541_05530 [Cyphellophora europaea CBS 101466]